MRKILILIFAALLLFLSSCTPKYTFSDAFNEISALDVKHNANIYTEALDKENAYDELTPATPPDWNRTNIELESVGPMLNDLELLKNKIRAMKNTEDAEAILLLIDIRKDMIESQKFYQQGLAFGNEASVRDGFKCGEREIVINASNYFNQSVISGMNATKNLDYLLTTYPVTREFLSDNNRPKFFDSPFYFIEYEAGRNKRIITNFCKE